MKSFVTVCKQPNFCNRVAKYKNLLLKEIWTSSNTWFLGTSLPTSPPPQIASLSSQPFCHNLRSLACQRLERQTELDQ